MTQFVLAVVLGALFALGTFLVLRRDIVRVIWGVVIIGQAANLYLVTMGGLSGTVPIIAGHGGGGLDPTTVTDPLVQALVLTAIVIGLGTTAFALVLTYRVYEEHGTIDLLELGNDGKGGQLSTDGGSPAGDDRDGDRDRNRRRADRRGDSEVGGDD